MRLHPVLPKALYFCFFGMWSLSAPFTAVFLATLVPKSFVGWTLGLMHVAALVFAPLWGFLADSLDRPRLVLVLLMLVGLGVRWGGTFFLSSDASPFVASGVFVGSELVFCGSTPVLDALVCKMLRPGEEFGHQRLFGAISWGVAAPLAGLLYERIALRWGLLMTLVGSLSVTACMVVSALSSRREGAVAAAAISHEPRVPVLEALKAARLRWQQWAFFAAALFAGFSNSSIGTFLFLHLQDLSGSSTLMGLAVLLMIVSEIPFMYYSQAIVARIGTFSCVLLGLAAHCLRCLGYQWLGAGLSLWFVLAIEPLHGVTFGVFYSACVSYIATVVSSERTRSTWQGVFSALFSAGKAAGAIGGGYLFQLGGGKLLFRVAALVLGCATMGFVAVVATDRGFAPKAQAELLGGEKLQQELEDVFSADEEEDDAFRIDED